MEPFRDIRNVFWNAPPKKCQYWVRSVIYTTLSIFSMSLWGVFWRLRASIWSQNAIKIGPSGTLPKTPKKYTQNCSKMEPPGRGSERETLGSCSPESDRGGFKAPNGLKSASRAQNNPKMDPKLLKKDPKSWKSTCAGSREPFLDLCCKQAFRNTPRWLVHACVNQNHQKNTKMVPTSVPESLLQAALQEHALDDWCTHVLDRINKQNAKMDP